MWVPVWVVVGGWVVCVGGCGGGGGVGWGGGVHIVCKFEPQHSAKFGGEL